MSSNDVVLRAEGLVRRFDTGKGFRRSANQVTAVDGVSLSVSRGEVLGLVGESGCGKSTVARLLSALDRPTSGSVLLDGVDLFGLDKRALRGMRRRVQLVLQDPYTSLDPRMTIAQIVGEAFEIHPSLVPPAGRRDAVDRLLERVGIDPGAAGRYPRQFSGGQRQRIAIARALATEPEVLICDEAVSALDVSVQAQVLQLLTELRSELKLAIVFISHDLSVVRHLADRVAVMYLGRVVEQGETAALYESSVHPYTQALLSAAPTLDSSDRVAGGRIVLQGDVPSPLDPPSGCRFHTRCWKAADRCRTEDPALVAQGSSGSQAAACHFPAVLG